MTACAFIRHFRDALQANNCWAREDDAAVTRVITEVISMARSGIVPTQTCYASSFRQAWARAGGQDEWTWPKMSALFKESC